MAPYVQDCVQCSVVPEFYVQSRDGQRVFSRGQADLPHVKGLMKSFDTVGMVGSYVRTTPGPNAYKFARRSTTDRTEKEGKE